VLTPRLLADERDPRTAMPDADAYEPPRVERVLTPAELEEEILYAGEPSIPR
jgi:hypothetical protein